MAAAPARLRYVGESDYDRFNNVRDDFHIFNDFYGLTWESATGKVSFFENIAQLLETGRDTLIVNLDDARKEIIIEITDMLGTDETAASDLIVYPNPTNDILTIEGMEIVETQVVNALGQQVMSFKGNKAHLGHLSQGVYLLKSTDTDGFIHQNRVVVRHRQ